MPLGATQRGQGMVQGERQNRGQVPLLGSVDAVFFFFWGGCSQAIAKLGNETKKSGVLLNFMEVLSKGSTGEVLARRRRLLSQGHWGSLIRNLYCS